jgi:hypothetical protein
MAFPTNAILGFPKPTQNYDWYACATSVATAVTSVPANCDPIVGADSNKPLLLTSELAGKFITALVSASNYQSTTRVLASTVATTETLTNLTAPLLSGDLFVGGTPLAVTAGGWSSYPAVVPANDITYAFFSCPTAAWSSSDCSAIITANTKVNSLTLTSGLQGRFVLVRVTASVSVNKAGAGALTLTSNAIGPIEAAPSFTSVPSASGVMHVDSVVTVTASGERGVPTPEKTYAWYICSSAVASSSATMPAGCERVAPSLDGATSLTLPAAAAGKFVSALVTISNSRGSVSASTASTLAVSATPEALVNPLLAGDDIFASGKSVTVTTGTWQTAPANATKSFAYSWYACPTPTSQISNCAYLADTPSGSIATSEAMVDKFVVAKVTITVPVNKTGAGTSFAYTNASSRIRKAAVFTGTPTVTGYMHAGETVTASTGSPSGVPAPVVDYTWFICPSPVAASVTTAPATCVQNNSSTNSTFVIPGNAAGSYVLVLAKASSDADLGSVTRSSVSTIAVSSAPVIGATKPAITGSVVLGASAPTVSTGAWTWKPTSSTATYSYKWFTCPSSEAFTGGSALPNGCVQIPNQTSNSLPLTNSQLGSKLLAEVTASVATNLPSPSRSSYFTAVTDVVSSKPAPGTTPPTISYTTLTAGSILKAGLGTWSGSPVPTLSYVWYTCPSNTPQPTNRLAPSTCTALTTKGDLTVLSTFKGLKILLVVTASNSAGTATNISALLTIP